MGEIIDLERFKSEKAAKEADRLRRKQEFEHVPIWQRLDLPDRDKFNRVYAKLDASLKAKHFVADEQELDMHREYLKCVPDDKIIEFVKEAENLLDQPHFILALNDKIRGNY